MIWQVNRLGVSSAMGTPCYTAPTTAIVKTQRDRSVSSPSTVWDQGKVKNCQVFVSCLSGVTTYMFNALVVL